MITHTVYVTNSMSAEMCTPHKQSADISQKVHGIAKMNLCIRSVVMSDAIFLQMDYNGS